MFFKKKPGKNTVFNSFLLLAALLITIAAVITGGYINDQGYNFTINTASDRKLKAPNKVENEIATQRRKLAAEEAAKKMEPLLKKDPEINKKVETKLEEFFVKVAEEREAYKAKALALAKAEKNGEVSFPEEEEPIALEDAEQPIDNGANLPVYLTDAQVEELMTMEASVYEEFTKQVENTIEKALEQGIQDLDDKNLLFVKNQIDKLDYDAETKNLCYEIVTSTMEPNIIIDIEATNKAREEKAADYQKEYFIRGQTIVDEGQIITEEIYAVLNSLGFIKKDYKENIVPIIGVTILVAAIFVFMFLYIYYCNPGLGRNRSQVLILFSLYLFVVVFSRLLIGYEFYYYIPILVFTMLIAILIEIRLAVVLNIFITVISLLIFKGDLEFLIYFLITGIATALFSRYTIERNKIIIVGVALALTNFIIACALSLFFEKSISPQNSQVILYDSLIAASSGIVVVILCVGSLPFWEAVFGIVTALKLLDLTNPNNILLRRLTIEAPGTYHHSLIVANLAETAAYDIGANPNIARVGGYYHDIGKLKYPQYFAENQAGENIHDFMDSYASAKVIISHVTYGLELADSYKLPKVIRDFIEQHHGTTLIKYFYIKAKKEKPEAEVYEDDFRYPSTVPQSRETAVVMLADTVEAAVRSMIPSGKTLDEVEAFVRTLVKDKLDDGQLIDSMLTVKDIDTISKSFIRVFKGMYHERIPYPKDEEKENIGESKDN